MGFVLDFELEAWPLTLTFVDLWSACVSSVSWEFRCLFLRWCFFDFFFMIFWISVRCSDNAFFLLALARFLRTLLGATTWRDGHLRLKRQNQVLVSSFPFNSAGRFPSSSAMFVASWITCRKREWEKTKKVM